MLEFPTDDKIRNKFAHEFEATFCCLRLSVNFEAAENRDKSASVATWLGVKKENKTLIITLRYD